MAEPEDEKIDRQPEKEAVENELKDVRRFVGTLKIEDLKNGSWFEKLLLHALSTYSKKVDADYFREKYPDLPADAVVQERIEMAARYAAIEGGLTSMAYTGAIAATIGSGGGASPLTLPAGGAAFVVDLAYLSQAQIKLAYDISVLYHVPLDLEDPNDLWKLIRIAFSIKLGEGAGVAVVKGVPAVVRPILKKFFARGVLAAAKSLPIIGKHLLQRNVIKFAIPVVSVPATVAVNFWTTKVTGRHAQNLMRTEAKLLESAGIIVEKNSYLVELLWAMWMTMNAEGSPADDQRTLLHHVTVQARQRNVQEADLAEFRNVIELDEEKVWSKLSTIEDLIPIYDAAVVTAAVGGRPPEKVVQVLSKMAELGGIEFSPASIRDAAKEWESSSRKGKRKHKKPDQKTRRPREP